MAAIEINKGIEMLSHSSRGHEESPSSSDDDQVMHYPDKKGKSLIERYKTLELLMKKKKMMAQVDAQHLQGQSNRVSNVRMQNIHEQEDEGSETNLFNTSRSHRSRSRAE